MIKEQLKKAKVASRQLLHISPTQTDELLRKLADRIDASHAELLEANERDLKRMDPENPMYDRLKLTPSRLTQIASDMRHVASLASPLGQVQKHSVLPNGLDLKRVCVPFGVIGVIYEARPNVTFDVAALCIKAGSACVLKGGKDAEESNICIVKLIHSVLEQQGFSADCVQLLPSTHEATAQLLQAHGWVDVLIPRGSSRLINRVREEARIPVIETGAGVVHCYIDSDADLKKAQRIILNAKTRRVSVCNAMDCLIVHAARLKDLAEICLPLAEKEVHIEADKRAYAALGNRYPATLLHPANAETYGTEFLDYRMGIKTVNSTAEAIEHIHLYGSGHSESIVSENTETQDIFLQSVDAACVYANAPTSFTDGAQFGLGAEIGISTQKLHARGPMALEEICTYKWMVRGEGQIREA